MKKYSIALIGNPNSGKTTLFNKLTNSRLAVGNRSGVTVENKTSACRFRNDTYITDLPGIYSLTPYSAEEEEAKKYIDTTPPDMIFNVINTENIRRGLYLTAALAGLGLPVTVVLNMYDRAERNGIKVNADILGEMLGTDVFVITSEKYENTDILIDRAVRGINENKKPRHVPRFGSAREIYDFADEVADKAVTGKGAGLKSAYKADRLLCHRFFAFPIFLLIMLFIFTVTFGKAGSYLSDTANLVFDKYVYGYAVRLLDFFAISDFLKGFICDGIIRGTGSVIAFFPQLMLLFFFMAILEESGYMARAAFIADRFFRGLGVSGKAFIPLLLGFGCSVPAIMSARTIENTDERKKTISAIPFMSCSAKLPVYTLFAGAFFPNRGAAVIFALYMFGVAVGLAAAAFSGKRNGKSRDKGFILELPPYRLPSPPSIFAYVMKSAEDFAVKVGTVILLSSAAVWIMMNVDFTMTLVNSPEKSILGKIGQSIAPIFNICGFGDWKAVMSLMSGLAAKEAVLSAAGILYSSGTLTLADALSVYFTPLSALSFLTFVLFYPPCISAAAAFRLETGSVKDTVSMLVFHTAAAWVLSALVYNIGKVICAV